MTRRMETCNGCPHSNHQSWFEHPRFLLAALPAGAALHARPRTGYCSPCRQGSVAPSAANTARRAAVVAPGDALTPVWPAYLQGIQASVETATVESRKHVPLAADRYKRNVRREGIALHGRQIGQLVMR